MGTRNKEMEQRLTRLEEMFVHLERTTEELNEVVVEQNRRIARLEMSVRKLHERQERLLASLESPRSAEDEKPPHY